MVKQVMIESYGDTTSMNFENLIDYESMSCKDHIREAASFLLLHLKEFSTELLERILEFVEDSE